MSENRCPLFSRHDFKNEIFYYFLPFFHEKRHVIGEKISQFQGVFNYIYNIKNIQSISFSLKENINILIRNEQDIYTKEFRNEILSFGYVKFYKKERLYKIFECKNKKIPNPPKFNCLLLEGKKKQI